MQDVLFVEPLPLGTDVSVALCHRGVHGACLVGLTMCTAWVAQGMMFMVCDGHAGVEAAKFVTETFHSLLCERLLLLPADLPHPSDKSGEHKALWQQCCQTLLLCPARKQVF